jgi:hypothetical protein
MEVHGPPVQAANRVLGLKDGNERFAEALAMSRAFYLCCTLD